MSDPDVVPLAGDTVSHAAFEAAAQLAGPPAMVNVTACGAGLTPVKLSVDGASVTVGGTVKDTFSTCEAAFGAANVTVLV